MGNSAAGRDTEDENSKLVSSLGIEAADLNLDLIRGVFGSYLSNIFPRKGLTAALGKAKDRSGGKVTGGGIQSREQMESVFTHNPPSP
jgi:hypothetical protein